MIGLGKYAFPYYTARILLTPGARSSFLPWYLFSIFHVFYFGFHGMFWFDLLVCFLLFVFVCLLACWFFVLFCSGVVSFSLECWLFTRQNE